MTQADDPAARIDALEIRVAHQDRVIEELNTALTEQWVLIDKLRTQMAVLDEELANIDHASRSDRSEPPPPHY